MQRHAQPQAWSICRRRGMSVGGASRWGRVRISGNFTSVLNRHRQASGSCVREKLCDRRVRASIRASRSLLFSIPGSTLFLFWKFLLPTLKIFSSLYSMHANILISRCLIRYTPAHVLFSYDSYTAFRLITRPIVSGFESRCHNAKMKNFCLPPISLSPFRLQVTDVTARECRQLSHPSRPESRSD